MIDWYSIENQNHIFGKNWFLSKLGKKKKHIIWEAFFFNSISRKKRYSSSSLSVKLNKSVSCQNFFLFFFSLASFFIILSSQLLIRSSYFSITPHPRHFPKLPNYHTRPRDHFLFVKVDTKKEIRLWKYFFSKKQINRKLFERISIRFIISRFQQNMITKCSDNINLMTQYE